MTETTAKLSRLAAAYEAAQAEFVAAIAAARDQVVIALDDYYTAAKASLADLRNDDAREAAELARQRLAAARADLGTVIGTATTTRDAALDDAWAQETAAA